MLLWEMCCLARLKVDQPFQLATTIVTKNWF